MAKKLPWCPWYVVDWLLDERVQNMSGNEYMIYHKLLMIQWREGSLPSIDRLLANCTRTNLRLFRRIWPSLEDLFEPIGGDRIANTKMHNIWMQKHALTELRASQTKRRAAVRKKGKRGKS